MDPTKDPMLKLNVKDYDAIAIKSLAKIVAALSNLNFFIFVLNNIKAHFDSEGMSEKFLEFEDYFSRFCKIVDEDAPCVSATEVLGDE